ncbi:uncharacterized protein PADG_06418 [Paracoccidioides brasiliensis Pb18]|uniref:FHA domain-containing protein n=1 Tax=Paracoccidioides brasiliensis (strain Pb18) TaxID=502780 RepID=C1GGI1_PARBD|nr:uncharacterized protein PADG_06418 [Paracoccidioides brasiliensis Pb18]EEH50339.2 hypothetical protein PADG_06418 [Paracoccidioides brasiliensis Pb18]
MESSKFAVTLTLLNSKCSVGPRVLTLSSDTEKIVIGRSSKATNKKLVPAQNNAWFDSRVMSRTHATITICSQKQQASITDTDSMHGTWLNGTKLVSNNKTPLTNRDILTFGAKITRGAETFEPLRVRLALLWTKEPTFAKVEIPKPNKRYSENTFVVPDDDDDDDEDIEDHDFDDPQAEAIVETTPDAEALTRKRPVEANSDVISVCSSDEDDGQEKSSPTSSPLSKPEDHSTSKPRYEEHPVVPPSSSPKLNPYINLVDETVTKKSGPQQSSAADACPDSTTGLAKEYPAVTDLPTEDDRDINAESGDEFNQFSDDEHLSVSDWETENLPFGTEAAADSGAIKPRTSGAENLAKAAIPSTPESLKTTSKSDGESGEPDRHPNHANNMSPSAFLTPALSSASKPGDNDSHIYSRAMSTHVSREQSSTVHPSVLAYKPSPPETRATGNRDRKFALGLQRTPSPSDKALARPIIDDSHGSVAENIYQGWAFPPKPNAQRLCEIAPCEFLRSLEQESSTQGGGTSAVTGNYDFPHLPPLRPPYSEGPFATSHQEEAWLMENTRNHAIAENVKDIYQCGTFAPARACSSTYRIGSSPPYPSSLHRPQWQTVTDGPHDASVREPTAQYPTKPASSSVPGQSRQATSIPIANIIDEENCIPEPCRPNNPLKRKAEEMSIPEVHVPGDPDGDEYLPDAQPQYIIPPPSTLTSASNSQSTYSVVDKQEGQDPPTSTEQSEIAPPQKKVKTEPSPARGSNFARYAASALVGAAVGGIGVVAALAALPPEFFA